MAKVVDRFIIAEVGDIDFVGANETPKQRIILFKPGYRDSFGDQKGRDEYWPADIIGKKVEELNIQERHLKQRVEATLYVSGNRFEKTEGGFGYAINVNVGELKMISPAQPAPAPASTTNQEEDDLPF